GRPARRMHGVIARDWVLPEPPGSRVQAAWVRRYRGWLQFRANGLAMAGLVTAAVMIVASLAAPVLAWQDPSAQNLAGRLAPPSFAHWLGTDELGSAIYARLPHRGPGRPRLGRGGGGPGRARRALLGLGVR